MSAVGKPSPQSPHGVARALGLRVKGGEVSWAALAGAAFEAYWTNRIVCGPLCGSRRGYDAHAKRGEKACQRCRQAVAMVKAVQRKRSQTAGGGAEKGKLGPLPVEDVA